jgi:hypothetical protein
VNTTVNELLRRRRRNRRPLLRPDQLYETFQLSIVQRIAKGGHALSAVLDLIFDLRRIHVVPRIQQTRTLLRAFAVLAVAVLAAGVGEHLRPLSLRVSMRRDFAGNKCEREEEEHACCKAQSKEPD